MPYKDGEPTLGEQFEEHKRQLEEAERKGFNEGAAEQFEADHNPKFSPPHKVSEGMNSLEAYRHLQKVEAEHALFKDTIRYMAENCHQAYHETGGWWDCKKNVCTAAQKQLPEYVLWLSGKGPKP